MFVKQLELFGFKTFADRTRIEFSPGITSVVGPNGCGKSNIADAILWVLGESNVRNIRGQRNTDVIFNGSEKRRALGVAEVTLTLDNSTGTLPLSFSEITVTRRAYRSGEAEYYINRSRCRLKDIYELFLDTGVGREAYSMITQGEIDAILSARPEDRRELFEEAAGVKKYRYRRTEALRKLEKTEANLNRVRDIMAEIGGQLEPLARQAEEAKRFEELQSRLRQIEIGLLIRDLHRFSAMLEDVRAARRAAEAEIERCDAASGELELEKQDRDKAVRELEDQIEHARKTQASLAASVGRIESRVALLEEKLRSCAETKTRVEEELRDLESRLEHSRSRLARLEEERESCLQNEHQLRTASEEKAAAADRLDRLFEEASRNADNEKASYVELARELAARRTALQNSLERIAQLQALIDRQQERIARLEAEADQVSASGKEASGRAEECRRRAEALASELSVVQAEASACADQLSQTELELAAAARESAAKAARLAALREMADAHEGFFEGVRSVMEARRNGKLKGSFRVVADAITVPPGLETAVETALGSAVQDIITGSVREAREAIEFLKANRAGRATFLPLDSVRPPDRRNTVGPDPRAGVLGTAADLVRFDTSDAPAILALLDGVVVVDSIDNAIAASRRLKGWRRIVTLEGELIVPSGAITGGAARRKVSGLISRKQEIESLEKETADLSARVDMLVDRKDALLARVESLRESSESAARRLAEENAALAEHQRAAEFAEMEAARIRREIEVLAVESQDSRQALAREQESAETVRIELESRDHANSDIDRRLAGVQDSIEELDRRRTAARNDLMQTSVELAAAVERTAAVTAAIEETRKAIDELSAALASRKSAVEEASAALSGLEDERDQAAEESLRERNLLAEADGRLAALIDRKTRESERTAAVDAKLRDLARARSRAENEVHEADVKEARLEVQVNQAAQRLLEEYEITSDQALSWPEDVEVERGTAAEVARLRREIREMGPVNTGAIQEYERIRERWEFLTAQRADLEKARDQINAAISEIDASTRDLFMNTFRCVAKNFEEMFIRLFGGGKAELSLTDPDNLLETGINVTVQPPGKKLQDMALMSGGERALTAAALVFALLMAKPSPFVVLDEVDAPLDESNVERFAQVLKDFSEKSQFIVITHNRATMEASDSLYGVTMEEPGVSKVISVKLSAEESEPVADHPADPVHEALGAQS